MKFPKIIFKKAKIRKIFFNLLLIFILLFNNLYYIFALESTSSAVISPTETVSTTPEPTSEPPPGLFEEPSPTPTPTPTPGNPPQQSTTPLPGQTSLQDISSTLEPTSGPTITPNILTTPSPQLSATIRNPIKSFLISKSHLTGGQSLAVGVLNAIDVELKTALFRDGEEVNMQLQKKVVGDVIVLVVDPPVSFTPGKYSLKITDQLGHTEEQSFLWGVLAINTDKSVYKPKEKVKIGMAVLDEEGKMLCDAKLKLQIKNEQLKVDDVLSTENGKIKITSQCNKKYTSSEPDYIATYQVAGVGVYDLSLTATTKSGTYSIIDSLEVKDDIPFIVERQDFPTRLNPAENIEVGLRITASQDFTGAVVEAVPDVVNVASSSATPYEWIATGVSKTDDLLTGLNSPNIIRYPFEGNYPVTLKFGEKVSDGEEQILYEKYGLKGHDGVDFALPEGTPVIAVDDGEVILAGSGAYGVTVVLHHSWGKSYYGHLQGTGHNLGDKVLKGDKIGLSGKTGLATGPHLHFGIKFTKNDMENGYYGKVDPWPYLTGSSILPGFSVRLIGWNVSLKKGETKDLRYRIDAPDISPQFYLFGPLRFYQASTEPQTTLNSPFVLGLSTQINSKPTFSEQRQWQMAVDAVESAQPEPQVLGKQAESQKAEKSIIHKGKPVNTNLKENVKAAARSRGERVAGVEGDEKLFRWEVELPHGTTFSFGQQETGGIKPVVKVRNDIGWFVEFSPISTDFVKPKVDGNQIEWEIGPGIIARYTALKDRIKADYIVKDKELLVSGKLDFNVSYNDEFSGEGEESDKALKQGKGFLTQVLTQDGEIDWLGENDWTYFTFPIPKVKDADQKEFDGSFGIKKIGKGSSLLSILIPLDKLETAKFPITIDPVTIDSSATATGTAFGNGRQIFRDAWGNLIVLCDCGSTNVVYYKNYNSTSWVDAGRSLNMLSGSGLSAELDSNGDIHLATVSSLSGAVFYLKYPIVRNGSNAITSVTNASTFTLDTAQGTRPSLIIANKGEGSGKEKIAVAWASNSVSGNPKNGEIRFAQCDVADDCLTAANWKNASEAENFSGTCSATAGAPTGRTCAGGADSLFNVVAHTTHHGVLAQVPGRPARTPSSAKFDNDGTFSDLSNWIDDNTGTTSGVTMNSANDWVYIGDEIKFSRFINNNSTWTAGGTLTLQYCSGVDGSNDCNAWTAVSNMIDNTFSPSANSSMSESGSVLFDEPSWVLGDVNGANNKYWIRYQNTLFNFTLKEIDVTDRHSKDLLIVGGEPSVQDLGAAYVIWDFIGQAGWENIPGNTTAPAPWRQGLEAVDSQGENWTTATNFPLSVAVDYINNAIYTAFYICVGTNCSVTSTLSVKYIPNNKSLTAGSSWSNVSFPAVTEATDINFSLTSDQNDIYLFYILDPGTNSLVYRKCDPRGGGTRDICDNAADWSSEKTLVNFVAANEIQSHPQAVVSKAYGDTTAIDVVYTDTNDVSVEYERHFVDMADKTIVVAASTDDAYHIDCSTGTDDQVSGTSPLTFGSTSADSNCVGSVASKYQIGFRFPNITILQGTAISSAYIDFRMTSQAAAAIDFIVYGNDVDNAGDFDDITNCTPSSNCTDADGDLIVNERTKTTTSSTQSINLKTQSYRLDVTDMVQEIVCRGAGSTQPCVGDYNGSGSWASGNAIAMLLITSATGNNSSGITDFDATGTTMLDPTLQINLGNTGKRYSMEVDKDATNSNDLDHPMEWEEFLGVNTDDSVYASVSASLVPSASSSAQPIFMFKANNTNNNNTDDLSATAIVKTSIPSKSYGGGHYSGRAIYLQVYNTTNGWITKDIEAATAADTDITLSSGIVSSTTSNYATESPGGSCSGSDCWVAWRLYQDSAAEANQILYVDNFSASFMSPTPTPASGPTTDQLLHHGAWFSAAGVEQPFTF